jgi:hypothetical protein
VQCFLRQFLLLYCKLQCGGHTKDASLFNIRFESDNKHAAVYKSVAFCTETDPTSACCSEKLCDYFGKR